MDIQQDLHYLYMNSGWYVLVSGGVEEEGVRTVFLHKAMELHPAPAGFSKTDPYLANPWK